MSNVEAIKKALEVAETLREYTDIDANEGANRDVVAVNPAAVSELLTTLEALQRENEALRSISDQMKLEAQSHSMEARGANATISEIYQIISGGKGEPGNWNGAEPVRQYVQAAKGEILRLEAELVLLKPVYSRRQIEARLKSLEEALTAIVSEGNKPEHSIHDQQRNRYSKWAVDIASTALASAGEEHHADQ